MGTDVLPRMAVLVGFIDSLFKRNSINLSHNAISWHLNHNLDMAYKVLRDDLNISIYRKKISTYILCFALCVSKELGLVLVCPICASKISGDKKDILKYCQMVFALYKLLL